MHDSCTIFSVCYTFCVALLSVYLSGLVLIMESLFLSTNGKHRLEMVQIPAMRVYVPPIVREPFILVRQEMKMDPSPHLNKLLSDETAPEFSGCKSTRSVFVAVWGYTEQNVRIAVNIITVATFQC